MLETNCSGSSIGGAPSKLRHGPPRRRGPQEIRIGDLSTAGAFRRRELIEALAMESTGTGSLDDGSKRIVEDAV
jgi:hypothetical protein